MTPALLTRMSILPNSSTALLTRSWACFSSVTSHSTAIAFPPSWDTFSTSSSRRSLRRAPATTAAPSAASARTVASPMPLEAPVTTATLPFNLSAMCITSLCDMELQQDSYALCRAVGVRYPIFRRTYQSLRSAYISNSTSLLPSAARRMRKPRSLCPRTRHVYLEHLAPLVREALPDPGEQHNAGVVDEYVHPPELLLCAPDQGVRLVLVGDVAGDCEGTTARVFYLLDQLVQPLLPPGRDHDRRTLRRECLCRRLADAARGAGDHRNRAIQLRHAKAPFSCPLPMPPSPAAPVPNPRD